MRYDGGKEKRNKGKKCIVCPEFSKRQLIDRGHISAHAFFSKLSLYYFIKWDEILSEMSFLFYIIYIATVVSRQESYIGQILLCEHG